MSDLKWLLISTLAVLASAYAGVLQSDQEPVHETIPDVPAFHDKLEAHFEGKDKLNDVPFFLASWSDTTANMQNIDIEELSEFLPVGSSYANGEYKISDLYLGSDVVDATAPPLYPNSATLPRNKIWMFYAIVIAIMTFKLV